MLENFIILEDINVVQLNILNTTASIALER